MTEVTMDIDTRCNVCNSLLVGGMSGSELYLDPCESCLDDMYEQGKKEAE